jgi:hypothetical protein
MTCWTRLSQTELVASTPLDGPQRATIRLTSVAKDDTPTVEYDLAGDSDLMLTLPGELDRWLVQIRPWYARIATSGVAGLVSLGSGIAALIMIADALPERSSSAATAGTSTAPASGHPFNAWTIPAVLGVFASKVQQKLFPVGYFAIGHDATRAYGRIRYMQGLVVVSVVLSIATGILANKLSR